MKIFDIPGFPNPLRVRIALAEKRMSAQVEFIKVDLPAAEHKQPAFLMLNPLGTVPVLQLEDGTNISECTAITEYLDNLDGNPILTGSTPKEKAVIHMMQKRAESELADPVGSGLGRTLRPLDHEHPALAPPLSPAVRPVAGRACRRRSAAPAA